MGTTEPSPERSEMTLGDAEWHRINPRYVWVLRSSLLSYVGFLVLLPWFFVLATEALVGPWMAWLTGVVLLVFVVLMVVWVPRRVRYTRYSRRPLEMHMRMGYLWRNTISVTINRIQHMEVTQGPMERLLGLSTLVLYTAGGFQSDLKLPGLTTADAHELKAQLLHQVGNEDAPEETSE